VKAKSHSLKNARKKTTKPSPRGGKQASRWPETFRWVATGVLVAYSAVGGRVVAPAYGRPLPEEESTQRSTQDKTYRFDIPAGSLDDVVDALEETSGVDIDLGRSGLTTLRSPGVQGAFTIDQAVDRALQGTGLVARRSGNNRIVLDLASSAQSVEVVATVPKLSSPKFTHPLVDTPQTIAVIPEQVFQEQGARNLTDVLRNTPGITFEAGENGFASGTSNFSLRGIDTTGNIFVDGARDSGNYFRDVFNLEQVEVVKGPAADNGRGGAGGYVNLATKRPGPETFHRLTFGYGFDEYGSRNRPRVAADINRTIGEGSAVRLNALWEDGGVVGREFAERKSWGLAPSVAFGLQGLTRFSAGYQVVKQEDVPDWGVPGAAMPGMRNSSPVAGGASIRSLYYGHVGDYDDVTSHALNARLEHDIGDKVLLTNTTRWSGTDREALYALPTGFNEATALVTTQRQAYARDNKSFTNLTNLSSGFRTGELEHSLTTGLELSVEGSNANRYPSNGILGNPGTTPVGNPDPWRPLPGLSTIAPTQTADIDVRTVAAYIYDTAQLHPKWLLSGGLRLERYGVNLDSRTVAGEGNGPAGFDRSDVTLNGKAGLTFKPKEEGSIYASFGVSALPPASFLSNPDISREGDNAFPGWDNGPNSASTKVQRARNYEIGTKWSFNRNRFNTSAALFRTERSNIAMAGTVNGVANEFAGYGKQIIQGVELGANGSITRAWSFTGGVLFMDSERRHSPEVDAARIAANPGDYGSATTTNGDQLAFTPRVAANLWSTYQLPLGLTLGGGIRHLGESYVGRPDNAVRIIANGNAGKLPGYTVGDLLAAYRINRQFTLRLNIDNITNRFYPISTNWAASRVLLGPARSFRIGTDFNF
jgi:catecholate siderophore receptor